MAEFGFTEFGKGSRRRCKNGGKRAWKMVYSDKAGVTGSGRLETKRFRRGNTMGQNRRTGKGNGFLQYISDAHRAIVVLALATLMTHGSLLFSENIGIDTEYIIRGKSNFDSIGRQGLIWLSELLGTKWFNPYMVQALTLLFMVCAPVCFGYLFYVYSGQKTLTNVTLAVLGVSYIVSPFWTEQLYFLNQSAQVTFACILTAAGIWLAEEGRRAFRTKWYYILGTLFLMQFTFSSYQILTMLYVVGVVMVFLCSSLKEDRTAKQQLQWILAHMGIFAAGLGLYWMITSHFFGDGLDYLGNQIGWGRMGLKAGILNCIYAVLPALRNTPPYYTGFYGIFALVLLAAAFYRAAAGGRFRKKKGEAAIFFLALLFLIGAPFVFCILYCGSLLARMQLVLPLGQGCMLYLTVLFLFAGEKQETEGAGRKNEDGRRRRRSCFMKGIAVLLTLAVLKNTMTDMGWCSRMYYTDQWRFQYDKQLAHDLYMELKDYLAENGYEEELCKKMVFIGYPLIPYNEACFRGEVIGRSIFEWDIDAGSINRGGRITDFMSDTGYGGLPEPAFSKGAEDAFYVYFIEYFGEQVDAMPSFPDAGSIQYLKSEEIGLDYLIVKLGPYWRSAIEGKR